MFFPRFKLVGLEEETVFVFRWGGSTKVCFRGLKCLEGETVSVFFGGSARKCERIFSAVSSFKCLEGGTVSVVSVDELRNCSHNSPNSEVLGFSICAKKGIV